MAIDTALYLFSGCRSGLIAVSVRVTGERQRQHRLDPVTGGRQGYHRLSAGAQSIGRMVARRGRIAKQVFQKGRRGFNRGRSLSVPRT
jgi:hypothetical protein